MIIAGTGHRPPRLGLDYSTEARLSLIEFAGEQLFKIKAETVISGMAQGWDQALAEAALEDGIPLICAVPFEGMEIKWPAESQKRYRDILERANEVIFVCKPGYSPSKFIKRDEYMVDNSDGLLALWDGLETGGTWKTVNYARKKNKQIFNVWKEWNGI